MSEQTIEELEAEYKTLLKSRIYDLQQGNTAVSRLEGDPKGQHSNMGGNSTTIDFSAIREHFKHRNGVELSGKPYSELVEDISNGVYKDKSRRIDATF